MKLVSTSYPVQLIMPKILWFFVGVGVGFCVCVRGGVVVVVYFLFCFIVCLFFF